MRKRKHRSKRNIIEQREGPIPGVLHYREVDGFSVNAWCPDIEAKEPPEQPAQGTN